MHKGLDRSVSESRIDWPVLKLLFFEVYYDLTLK